MHSRNLGRCLREILLALAFAALLGSAAVATEPKVKAIQFSERIAAGGPSDYMTVRHLTLRGSQRAIGKKLAEIAQLRHNVKPLRLDPEVARQRREFYKSTYPAHYERALGVKEHFGTAIEGEVDPTALAYNLPPSLSCSVVYYPPSHTDSGHAKFSRNYDWMLGTWADFVGPSEGQDTRQTTGDPYVMEVYPDSGYASLYLCAYEMLGGAIDGVNSEGLTVAILTNNSDAQATPTNAWRPGLGELEIGRFLLDTCASVDEAKKALASVDFYYAFVPCHYIIGDRDGNSFVWEYSVNLKQRYFTDGKAGPQWVTNHPIHRKAFPTVESIPPTLATQDSFVRFRRLHDEIDKASVKRSTEEMKHANRCVAASGGSVRTLWHALYDCHDSSLEVDFFLGVDGANGKDKRSGYVRFQLED